MPPLNWHKYRKTALGLRKKREIETPRQRKKRKYKWEMLSEELSKSKRGKNSDGDDTKGKHNGGDNGVVMIACHAQGSGRSPQVYGLTFAQFLKFFNFEYAKNMLRMLRLFRCLISLGLPFPFFLPLHFCFILFLKIFFHFYSFHSFS